MHTPSQEVASFLENLLPDTAQRRSIFSALAESILESNQIDSGLWGVTLRRDRSCIRLNAGPIEVFVISRNEPVRVVIDSGMIVGQQFEGVIRNTPGDYESVKSAEAILVPASRFAEIWPALRNAHFALLRLACERRRGYSWKDSHSPDVIAYLSKFLEREVPNPAYSSNAIASSSKSVPDETALLRQLTQTCDSLLADGKLLSSSQLDASYARFADQFGPDALKAMDGLRLLEHMHDHGNKGSLVYWLEYKDDVELPDVFGSIVGGSALKFGIYRRKESRAWITGSNQNQRALNEEEAVAIARRHRDQLVAAAEVVAAMPARHDDQTYADLQRQLHQVAPDVADSAWGHKYLHMLFPTKLENYHVVDFQRFYLLKLLQIPPREEGRYAAGGRYVELATELGRPMVHITSALEVLNGRPYRYWRIGAGVGNDGRKHWPMMRDGSVVAIGWPALGDLSSLRHDSESRDEIRQRLDRHYPADPRLNGKLAQQIFNFATTLAEGHLVVVSDGATVLGIGKLLGPYSYFPQWDFPHQRQVKWLDVHEWRMPEPEGLRTAVSELRRHPQNLIAIEHRLLVGEQPPPPAPPLPPQTAPKSGERSVKPVPTPTPTPPLRRAPPLEGISGELQRILERKGQAILYGPPGTGKTHWAEQTARELASLWALGRPFAELDDAERRLIIGPEGKPLVRMCCFHPSYGYEDFIEGHRPDAAAGGALTFQLRAGVFKSLCIDALNDPERRYYLIIDEINRGDIPRIFGELLTLLEPMRRGTRQLVLPLSGKPFTVPPNVYVIGTMNTADRSIALIDVALRRRFGFVELMPALDLFREATIEGVPLGPLLRLINQRIRQHIGRDARNLQIGHSFFLQAGKPLSDFAQLRRVLLEDVIPLLEEYCYDDWEKFEQILGSRLVDGTDQRVRRELFEEAAQDQLVAALLALDPSLATSREATAKGADADLPEGEDDDEEAIPTSGPTGNK